VIGMGPGPFTGLRTGIAFGQAIAFAKNIPWLGVCSLDAIAGRTSNPDFIVATDARRKEVFYARYIEGVRQGEPDIANPKQLETLGVSFIGEGAVKYGLTTQTDYLYPNITSLIELSQGGEIYDAPIYIRRPDAYPAPKDVIFRPWQHLDLVPIHVIEKESYLIQPWSMAQLKEEFAAQNRFYLVAELKGEIVGYAGAMKMDDCIEILTLTVAKAHRRKGIARELLRRIVDYSRVQKSPAIMLEMREGNAEASGLYQSFGFIQIARRENYYAPKVHALIMRKELI
jgi:ribosomal-protein-alanine acetyltransferase